LTSKSGVRAKLKVVKLVRILKIVGILGLTFIHTVKHIESFILEVVTKVK
jgi:hypothetical protein